MKVWLPALRAGTGADVFVSRLESALRQRGVEVEVTWFPAWYEFVPELLRIAPVPADADLIHANTVVAGQFLGRGRPVVATVHHLVHDPMYAPHRNRAQAIYHNVHLRWRERVAIREAAAVTAVSRYVGRSVQLVFGRTDVVVVPNWVDCDRFVADASWRPERQRFRLLIVGNRTRRKGLDLVRPLSERLGPRYEIRCTGGLRGQVGETANDGVLWLGTLDEDELISQFQQCDVVVSLSRYEGFGYSALEGMACGKPVVAFDAGGLGSVVCDGVGGFLAPVDDLDALGRHIVRLDADQSLYARMSIAAREIAVAHSNSADGYLEVYRHAMERTPA